MSSELKTVLRLNTFDSSFGLHVGSWHLPPAILSLTHSGCRERSSLGISTLGPRVRRHSLKKCEAACKSYGS